MAAESTPQHASPLGAPGYLEAGLPPQVTAPYDALVKMVEDLQALLAMLVAAQAVVALATSTAPTATAWPGGGRAHSGPQQPEGGRWPQLAPRDLSGAFLDAGEEDLEDIDKEDVLPPGKYRGDAAA